MILEKWLIEKLITMCVQEQEWIKALKSDNVNLIKLSF
jgi:hypothetical protein